MFARPHLWLVHHQNIAAGGVAPDVLEGAVEGVVCLGGDLVLALDLEGDLVLILGLAPAVLDSSPCLLAVIEIRGGGGPVIRTLRVLVSA